MMRAMTRLFVVLIATGCAHDPGFDLQSLPPAIILSPSLSNAPSIVPGETAELTVQLYSVGGTDAPISVEIVQAMGDAFTLTEDWPDVMAPDDRHDLRVTFAPLLNGSAVAYVHVTTTGSDACNETWAVVRGHASDGVCDPDDLDCDGQTATDGDCDDDDEFNGIGFAETCDGKDNNCDGSNDPQCNEVICGHPAP